MSFSWKPLVSWLGGRDHQANQCQRRKRKVAQKADPYATLEPRSMLAAIVFDATTGDLTVAGDNGADVAKVTELSGNRLQVELSDVTTRTFSISDINSLSFLGFGGNDNFANNSSLPSFMWGGPGNDVLTGGTSDDVINGASGNDRIFGRDGNDRLIANLGDDEVSGGNGNDRIFGTGGANILNGNAGNDVIYGGEQADTISGGNDIDQIFGLAGNDIINSGNGGVIGSSGVAQADLVLGQGGNDQITGGDGLNVFWGGDGVDTFIGGSSAENRFHGQDGDDIMTGGTLGDFLKGGNGNDTIRGLAGNDYIIAEIGNDTVDGGGGTDFMVFSGQNQQHRINGSTTLTVRDRRDITENEGTDTVNNVERFRFANGDFDAESPILEFVTVRPIVVSNSNGSSTATSMGTAAQEAEIKELVDDILYQALVDVRWEADRSWNNTFANQGNGGARPANDLFTIVDNGDAASVGSTNSLVVDLYFINVVPGSTENNANSSNGIAIIGSSGVAIRVGSNLPGFQNGRRAAAQVVAHEIAHNFGLIHVDAPGNLLGAFGGTNLNSSQINTIRNSSLTRPV